jgi:hypothetical protein
MKLAKLAQNARVSGIMLSSTSQRQNRGNVVICNGLKKLQDNTNPKHKPQSNMQLIQEP